MVEEIKKIEQEKLLAELQRMDGIIKIKKEIEKEIQEKEEEEKRLLSRKKPSLFSRIFKTKKLKTYLLGEKSLSTIQEEIKELKKQKLDYEEQLKDYYSKKEEYETRKTIIEGIKTLTDLRLLGYTFEDAIKVLKESGKPIVLTEEEKQETVVALKNANENEFFFDDKGFINNKEFESLSDLIMVHKTNYPPTGEKIHSRASGKVLHNCSITLGGEEYSFTCKSGRNTVHLSTNHEVAGNNGGDWSQMKYAVLIPFEDLKETSEIASARAVDTYTRGPVTLTKNSYILCPKGEGAKIQLNNPSVTVIEYEGENVQDYANMLIARLGYKLELGHDHGFYDAKQANIHSEIMRNAGFGMKKHFWSEDKEKETELGILYQVVGLIQLIKDKGLLKKIGREQLIEELNKNQFDVMLRSAFGDNVEGFEIFKKELHELGIDIDLGELKEMLDKHIEEKSIEEIEMDYILNQITKAKEKTER